MRILFLASAFLCLIGDVAYAIEDCNQFNVGDALEKRLECLQNNNAELLGLIAALEKNSDSFVKVGETVQIAHGELCLSNDFGGAGFVRKCGSGEPTWVIKR